MTDRHPYVTWMLARYSEADSPLATFAHTLRDWPGLPTVGTRRELYDFLARANMNGCGLRDFNVTWLAYEAACLSPACTGTVAPGSAFCTRHGGRRHSSASK